MDRFFRISERGSGIGTEVLGGVVTFATMAYILIVNPSILGSLPDGSGTTLDHGQLVTVTALVAGVMTIAMGLFANVPMALAAGLGVNAFVAFTLVGSRGLTWPEAMGVIVIEGVVMLVLVLVGLREAIMNAIPDGLKRAIAGGIGLFIALIGLVDGGIVTHPESGTIVALSQDISSWNTLVFVVALVLIAILMSRRVPGALLIGIVLASVVGVIINAIADKTPVPGAELPDSIAAAPDFGLVGDISFNVFDVVGFGAALALIVTVLMANFFDAMGTALAIGREANLIDDKGQLPQMRKVLVVESVGAIAGGAGSASSNTIFVESTAGVAQGARTGLANVVTGVLFLLSMFFAPLAGIVPAAATGPALVVVGALMISQVAGIDWNDMGIALPAFATLVMMPFTYSIANGVGAGMVLYTIIALGRGDWRRIHPLMAVVAALFVWYFARGVI
ncbi:putative MFS transporter, AGZA family, xanthine/uracil permease [Nocardioides terrae]|uniref:Putative MFS transporter, AGZA family, xanthine/uracil permease n=1 Tax=Nocardioides terrae TaxID=574651 RepID=A0A1I1JXH7_9ACTN|nr:NCS2 family permease [Nocardioides terrae]SFC53206.1 putative MFS transporter, AGZA family, xanthine/uracil permease [Nocardioides terrae]